MLIKSPHSSAVELFHSLQHENKSCSLPARGMLWNALQERLKSGTVYTESTTSRTKLFAVVGNTSEYCDANCDTVSLWAESGSHTEIYGFLQDLAAERNWDKIGVIFCAVTPQVKEAVRHLFQHTVFEELPDFLYTDPQGSIPNVPRPEAPLLPLGFALDTLKETEAEYVASTWDFSIFPDRVATFRFMIRNFSNLCVRNDKGEPVSFILEYEHGAGAALFTEPQYRNRGLAKTLLLQMIVRHSEKSPVPFYCGLEPGSALTAGLFEKIGMRQDKETPDVTTLWKAPPF